MQNVESISIEQTKTDMLDRAWRLLEKDKIKLNLMLTSWAKCNRDRNNAVHLVPSVKFAERYIASDKDFRGEVQKRAIQYIQNGQDLCGERLFKDY